MYKKNKNEREKGREGFSVINQLDCWMVEAGDEHLSIKRPKSGGEVSEVGFGAGLRLRLDIHPRLCFIF